MGMQDFKANSAVDLLEALEVAIVSACNQMDFDLRCLDWFSYHPDFFIEQKNIKAA